MRAFCLTENRIGKVVDVSPAGAGLPDLKIIILFFVVAK